MPASKASRTGLTDNVAPGDIANLSQSSELAFRATFSGDIPVPHERYWRAIVLEQFDGKRWQVSPQRTSTNRQYARFRQEFSPTLTGRFFEYEILAVPSHQRWLFGLDIAVPNDPNSHNNIWQSHDYQLISHNPLVNRFRYTVRSYPEVPLNQSLASLDRRINLQVPSQGNPLTQKWIKQLRQDVPDDRMLVNAIMSHFSQQSFKYTLQPRLMPVDPVDTFLFTEKAGFCSHYASAMTYALRLAGIPARMVTGYQGGEMREQDYMSVYQYDAHAWVEAWIDETGWQRFDPTAIVSPDRIQFGLETAMQEEGSFLKDAPFSLAKLKSIQWLNELRLALADMDYLWSKWVLGFNNQTQRDLLKGMLGKLTPERLAIFGLVVFSLICGLITLFYLPKWRRPARPFALQYYQMALNELAKIGIDRHHSMAPLDFVEYVETQASTEITTPFQQLTTLFINDTYRKNATDKKTLIAQKVDQMDAVVVAIGENFEATILTALNLIDLNIARIIVRASGFNQVRILKNLGVEEILTPEVEVAQSIAEKLINPSITGFLQLPDNYEIAEIKAPRGVVNRTIEDIDLRNKYSLTLVTLKRAYEMKGDGDKTEFEEHTIGVPKGDTVIYDTDTLVVFGTLKNIKRFIGINE